MVPPSMLMTWPLIQAPSSEHRKATSAAMSSGSPTRVPRMRFSAPACRSGHCGAERMASVAVNPGATALHRMPSFPHRDATCLVSAADSGFCGGIGRSRGLPLEGCRRRHVDDRPAAATQHPRDGVLHRGQVSAEVHRHHAIPGVEVDIHHIGVDADGAHVRAHVEQEIDSAVSGYGGVDQGGNRSGIRQIEGEVCRCPARRDDARGGLPRGVDGDVADDHLAALRAQPSGRRCTDARGTAYHDRDLFGQTAQPHARPPQKY